MDKLDSRMRGQPFTESLYCHMATFTEVGVDYLKLAQPFHLCNDEEL